MPSSDLYTMLSLGDVATAEILLDCGRYELDDTKSLREAAKNGYLSVVKQMFELGWKYDQPAIEIAYERGHLEIVDFMLMDPQIHPIAVIPAENYSIRNKTHLELAFQYNRPGVVEQMLDLETMDPSWNNAYALRAAAQKGYISIVERLLSDSRLELTTYGSGPALDMAIRYGHLAIVKRFLEDDIFRITQSKSMMLCQAVEYRHLDLVEFFLKDPDTNPATNMNYPVRKAAENGDLAILDCLLANPRVDPSDYDNSTIELAAENNHRSIVIRLLADSRVDVNKAFCDVILWNDIDMVRLFLDDPRTDPAYNNNIAIICAARNGNLDILELLLADPRVNPAAQDNEAVCEACIYNHRTVLERLLADPRVDPSKHIYKLLFTTYKIPSIDISTITILLSSPRLDLRRDIDKFIRICDHSSHSERYKQITELLLENPRVAVLWVGPSAQEKADRAASRTALFKEDLIAAAWRPDRFTDWCLDIEERTDF